MGDVKCVVHISNDYCGSTVYKSLVGELDRKGVQQIVYSPLRDKNKIGANAIVLKVVGSKMFFSPILNWHIDRVFFPYKIYKVYKDIQRKIDFDKVGLIHAHTWYSDGAVAYFLSKKYNLPFILAVRSTDLNVFQKRLVYLRPLGRKIMQAAKSVVLISESYKSLLWKERSLRKILGGLMEKTHVLPNGVDAFWLENSLTKDLSKKEGRVDLIYVGKFVGLKNLTLVQKAVVRINKSNNALVHLHIVGGGGEDEVKVLEMIDKYPGWFTYYGKVHGKEELMRLYRGSDIFVMPSKPETFGLVYIEAMLQGLPVLYTEGEGVDGFYADTIGEKISNPCLGEIQEKLEIMFHKYSGYEIPLEAIKRNHDWTLIAEKYIGLYRA